MREYGFPPDEGMQVAEDKTGAIWIGAQKGLFRFFGGRVELVMKAFVISLAPISPAGIVAATGPGGGGFPSNAMLIRVRPEGAGWRADTIMEMHSEGRMTLDRSGIARFPCSGTWCEARVEDLAGWRPGDPAPVVRHEDPWAGSGMIAVDRFGCLWWWATGGSQYRCPGQRKSTAIDHGLTSISEAPDGSLVIPDPSQIAIGRPGAFRRVTTVNGLPPVAGAIVANDGTLWISSAQGITRLALPFRLEYWTDREGVAGPWASTQLNGKVFTTSTLGGIAVLSADRSRWMALDKSRSLGGTVDLLPTPQGTLLIGLRRTGAAEVAQDGTILARSRPEDTQRAMKLARTPDGQVWAAGPGVGRVRRLGDRIVIEPEDLPAPRENGFDIEFEPNTGKLWACYEGGLVVRDIRGSWQRFTTKDGLVKNPCRALAAHPNGDLWMFYLWEPAFGLIRPFGANRITVRNYRDGEAEIGSADGAEFLDVDSRGWIWRGSSDSISVADPAGAEAGLWFHLNETDGLPLHATQENSFRSDADGSVWWSGGNAIMHFNPPADFVRPARAPGVFISAFSWDGGAPKLAESVSGIPHGAMLTVHAGSLQFDRRNALRLRYRLLPEQPEWRASRALDLALGKLPWGTHTVEIQGQLLNGPWSGTVSQSFNVLKPVWLTWPMLLGFAVTGCSASGAAWVLRRRRAKRERQQLPDLGAWRIAVLSPEVHDLIADVLDGRYEVERVIGRGGFATVLDGRDRAHGNQRCAIKVFHRELADNDWIERRFQQEVAALDQVKHPNIVRIFGHGTTPAGSPYLVMEFVEGLTLRDVLEAGKLHPKRIAGLMRQAGRALAAIHGHGIFHRDLKPENIMLRSGAPPDRELVILDFSIAIVKDPTSSLHGLTRAAGSIVYMAPENAVGYADPSTDIHSLAKILLEMLTGRRLVDLLPDASIDLPARARDLLAKGSFPFSQTTVEAIGSALEFHPLSRPRNAAEFSERIADELESAS